MVISVMRTGGGMQVSDTFEQVNGTVRFYDCKATGGSGHDSFEGT